MYVATPLDQWEHDTKPSKHNQCKRIVLFSSVHTLVVLMLCIERRLVLKLKDNVVVRSSLRGGGVHAGRSQYSRRFTWRKIDVVQGKGAEYGKII